MPPSRPDANGGGTHSSPALDPLSATAGAMDEVPAFTAEQVASHNTAGDCWITIDGDVYDVSAFAALHPGGRHVLQAEGGRDASGLFRRFHHPRVLDKYRPRLRIGRLAGYEDPNEAAASLRAAMLPRSFGDLVPYGDPAWYQRFNSPYYSESHRRWRADLRTFLEAVVFPTIPAWRESSSGPDRGVYKAMGRRGLLALMAGPPFPAEYLATDVAEGRVQGPPEGFDYFHELILYDELARQGDGRIVAALTNGPAIASPVIQRFAAPALAREVLPPLLRGETFAALAISEPNAGSDVAGLLCTASAEVVNGSRVYRVNGNKKWITNGTYADHFVTAVVTGTPGQGGLSFLLVDRDTPGLSVRKVAVRDADVSGTAYLDFDECLVPAERLLGEEGDGFRMIMHNFVSSQGPSWPSWPRPLITGLVQATPASRRDDGASHAPSISHLPASPPGGPG